MQGKNKSQLIKELIEKTNEKFEDEELMHMLIDQKISTNINENDGGRNTLGQRAADAVARFAGSWAFIFTFFAIMAIWTAINIMLSAKAFDAYPFILLNLLLSCIAAVQAPFIMMSQNRQEEKDRTRSENDYKVNLKNELVIDDLHLKLDSILKNQKKIFEDIKKIKEKVEKTGE